MGSGFNILGFFTGNITATIKTRNGLNRAKEDAKDLSYIQVPNTAEKEPVILYDTESGNERAWMVSELSLILELFNVWAFQNEIPDIKYAEPGPNGGAEARVVLADDQYAKRVVVKKYLDSESDKQIRDIIKGIYGRIQQSMKEDAGSDTGGRGVICLGRTGIIGWDWLDLTDLSWTMSYRREVGRHKGQQQRRRGRNLRNTTRTSGSLSINNQPCWMPFTQVVPVFFGQRMGELIMPARQAEVCGLWHPIPGGVENQYLAASIHCLRNLAARFDHTEP